MPKIITRIGLAILGFWAVVRLLLDVWGYMDAIKSAFENRGEFVKAIGPVLASQWLPVCLFIIGVVVLACIEYGSPKTWMQRIWKSTPEPQPIFVARDQLEFLLNKGKSLANRFQFSENTPPTPKECGTWNEEAVTCARQKIFENVIRQKDRTRFTEPWDHAACGEEEAKLDAQGYLKHVDDVGRAAFRWVWRRVQRLEELLAIVDGKAPSRPDSEIWANLKAAWIEAGNLKLE